MRKGLEGNPTTTIAVGSATSTEPLPEWLVGKKKKARLIYCSRCKRLKGIRSFYPSAVRTHYRGKWVAPYCKVCVRTYSREYRRGRAKSVAFRKAHAEASQRYRLRKLQKEAVE